MGESEDYSQDIALIAHALTHKLGGSDEIDISGLIFKSCCYAHLSVNQAIPTLDWTLLQLDTAPIDRNNDFSTTAHKFICPVAGVYLALAQIFYAGAAADKYHYAGIYLNGAPKSRGTAHSAMVQPTSSWAFALLDCAIHDEITMYASHNRGENLDVLSDNKLTFLIVLSLYET